MFGHRVDPFVADRRIGRPRAYPRGRRRNGRCANPPYEDSDVGNRVDALMADPTLVGFGRSLVAGRCNVRMRQPAYAGSDVRQPC